MFESKRLILRELTPEDAEQFYLLNTDHEVIRYTGDEPFESIESAKQFLEKYDQYQKYGFGRWAVILKADNSFLGWCGLKYTLEKDEVDVGFRFFRKYWNLGYATESAQVSLETGREKFGINEIVGRAMKENLASVKVLEKIGLTYFEDFNFDGCEGVIYKINF